VTGRGGADNQAGICILYEAGGAAFGAKTKPLSGEVDADLLGKSPPLDCADK
jgi:hypothetical protein